MNKYIARNRILLLLLILLSAIYGGLTAVVPIAAGSIIDFDAAAGQTLLFFGSMKDLCIMSASILACIVVFGILKVLVRTTYIYRVRKQIENDVFYAAIRSKVSSSSLINMFCLEIDKIIDGYSRRGSRHNCSFSYSIRIFTFCVMAYDRDYSCLFYCFTFIEPAASYANEQVHEGAIGEKRVGQ